MPAWLTTRRRVEVELPVSPDRGAHACRAAVIALGWELGESAGDHAIAAAERADGLCCVVWPVDLEITVEPTRAGSLVAVAGSTPGRGPLQRRQLRDRLNRLRGEILRRAEKS